MSDPLAGKYELYRIVTDYDALREGFADRIEDLNTPMSEIDTAAELTPGHTQKLLCKSDSDWARSFTWKTLGPMLKGTGLALVLVVDDERFASVKATLAKRRRRNKLPNGSIRQPAWLITRKASQNMQFLRNRKLSPQQRKRIAKTAAKARWSRRNRKRLESGVSHDIQTK